jgi:glycine/D-amino acid oxidase-like deaminating enzyme
MDDRTADIDVLVIGAGLIGAMIANQLANGGRRVAVVDAQKAAQAATRRAVGIATPHPTRAHISDTVHGVDLITNLALQLAVSPRACRVMHVASTPAATDALRAACEELKGNRPKLLWETKPGAVPAGYSGGMVVHNSVLLDLDVLTIRLLQHTNITMREDIEIQALDASNSSISALASGYTVRANAIVLATNAYAGILSPYLGDAVRLVRGVTWSSKPLDRDSHLLEHMLQAIPMPLIIDDARLVMAQTRDWRLRIFARDADNQGDPTADIAAFLRAHAPKLAAQTEEWRYGVTSLTSDSTPLIGRLAGAGTVVYALGAGMYGAAWAPIIAERVQALVEA